MYVFILQHENITPEGQQGLKALTASGAFLIHLLVVLRRAATKSLLGF